MISRKIVRVVLVIVGLFAGIKHLFDLVEKHWGRLRQHSAANAAIALSSQSEGENDVDEIMCDLQGTSKEAEIV